MTQAADDLLDLITASPTPYHAVVEAVRRLAAAGFRSLDPAERWETAPGDRAYVTQGDGSVIAFVAGTEPPARAGFRVLGAHTDSPNLRLKPLADGTAHGYRRLACEIYGGVLLHTWLDRDLGLAGRVTVASDDGEPRGELIDVRRPVGRVPSLAIHLQREIHEQGVKLNAQDHLVPVVGLEAAPDLAAIVNRELETRGVPSGEILAHDLMFHDLAPPAVAGAAGEFLFAPRLDNLASCHAALCALVETADEATAATRVVALHDHEEIGSRTAHGAAGPMLDRTLERLAEAHGDGGQELARAAHRSALVSVDMAHAVHPNRADKHEAAHRPVLGGGPVIKVNARQAYATDATTAGWFRAICRERDVAVQHFVARNDMPCGSTIGPIASTRTGLPTLDVGNPMLSMHSAREMAGTADVAPMIAALAGTLLTPRTPA